MEDNEAKRRRLMERMGGPGGSEGFNGGFSAPPVQRVAPTAVAVAKPVKKAEEPDREDFVMNSNEAVCFRLVHTEADLETAEMFNPEFTHQVFREDETIFGFKELEVCAVADASCPHHPRFWAACDAMIDRRSLSSIQINVYMHAVSFHTFIDIQHKGTAPTQFGPPDNIEVRKALIDVAAGAFEPTEVLSRQSSIARCVRRCVTPWASLSALHTGEAQGDLPRRLHDGQGGVQEVAQGPRAEPLRPWQRQGGACSPGRSLLSFARRRRGCGAGGGAKQPRSPVSPCPFPLPPAVVETSHEREKFAGANLGRRCRSRLFSGALFRRLRPQGRAARQQKRLRKARARRRRHRGLPAQHSGALCVLFLSDRVSVTAPFGRALHSRIAPFVLFEIDGGQLISLECVPFA